MNEATRGGQAVDLVQKDDALAQGPGAVEHPREVLLALTVPLAGHRLDGDVHEGGAGLGRCGGDTTHRMKGAGAGETAICCIDGPSPMTRAIMVLPQPGGPSNSTARGTLPPFAAAFPASPPRTRPHAWQIGRGAVRH